MGPDCNPLLRLRVRGFDSEGVAFDERHDLPDGSLPDVIVEILYRHQAMIKAGPHMIEIEFLDESEPEKRFLRFGTDPRCMVASVDLALFRDKDRSEDFDGPVTVTIGDE